VPFGIYLVIETNNKHKTQIQALSAKKPHDILPISGLAALYRNSVHSQTHRGTDKSCIFSLFMQINSCSSII